MVPSENPNPLLHTRISDIKEPQLLELLEEIAQVKYMPLSGFQGTTLFNYLTRTQLHPVTSKPENIQAAGYYQGCLLKRRVKDAFGEPMEQLAVQLCRHFGVSEQFIDGKQYYVFLNQILNPKSKLRKPPPFRL